MVLTSRPQNHNIHKLIDAGNTSARLRSLWVIDILKRFRFLLVFFSSLMIKGTGIAFHDTIKARVENKVHKGIKP